MPQALKDTQRNKPRLPDIRTGINSDGCFAGYASLFGKVDHGNDVVRKGAFSNFLARQSPGNIRMLFQHDPAQPIGVWTRIVEDTRGLYVEGKITCSAARCSDIFELVKAGAVDGLSIGFRTRQARKNNKTRVREILSLDLWEISIVTFPLLQQARIESFSHPIGKRKPGSLDKAGRLTALIRKATRKFKQGVDHGPYAYSSAGNKSCDW